MPKTTVLSLVSTIARCGVINVLEGIVLNSDKDHFRHVVCTLSPEKPDSDLPRLKSWGIKVKQLNVSKLHYLVQGPHLLRHVVKEFDANLVHSHGFRPDTLVSRANLPVPIVTTLHADLDQDYGNCHTAVTGSLLTQLHYLALRKMDKVFSVSDFVAAAARRWSVFSEVIRNGIDLKTYFPARDARNVREFRRKLGLPADRLLILHNSTLIERKRPVQIIDSFLRSKLSERALLLFCNEGPLEKHCRWAARDAKNIRFLGNCLDVPNLLRSCDVLVSNSSAEGLPMGMLEGCASGLHICATDIPPHQTIQHLFPEQVLLFDSHSGCALVRCFNWIAERKPRMIVQPTRESLESISATRMSHMYHRCYEELSERKSEAVRTTTPYSHRGLDLPTISINFRR